MKSDWNVCILMVDCNKQRHARKRSEAPNERKLEQMANGGVMFVLSSFSFVRAGRRCPASRPSVALSSLSLTLALALCLQPARASLAQAAAASAHTPKCPSSVPPSASSSLLVRPFYIFFSLPNGGVGGPVPPFPSLHTNPQPPVTSMIIRAAIFFMYVSLCP